MNYLKLTFIALFISLPFAFWGWTYEFSYFNVLGLNVFDTFTYIHYVFSGGIWVLIFFGVIIFVASIEKFFSKNIEKNDWEVVKEALAKTRFSDVIGQARLGFILSIIYLLTVIYIPSGYWFLSELGNISLLITFSIVQLFFAGLWLSPQHSKFAVILTFIISIGACLAAGGIANARTSIKLEDIVRDDYLVTIAKTSDGKFTAVSKPLRLPIPSRLEKLLIGK